MKPLIFHFALLLLGVGFSRAADTTAASGWKDLFNGKDLTGWVRVNCAPNTFTVRDGIIVSTGVPTGIMHSDKQYENFELELDWKHIKPGGNAGMFVWAAPMTAPGTPFARAIEVQILDGRNNADYTSHGDLFSIHGATFKPDRPHPKGWMRSLPSEQRANPAGQWNHYHVVCSNGVIKLSVNGKEVSGGSESKPRKGYLCLEAEGSECHFRNIRIRELPSTNPKPNEIAPLAEDFKSLYTGIDLNGWKPDAGHTGHWQPKDWILDYDGKSTAADKNLWSEKEYGDFVLICDWRWTAKGAKQSGPTLLPDGAFAKDAEGKLKESEILSAGESGLLLRGSDGARINLWGWTIGSGGAWDPRAGKNLSPEARAALTPKAKADNPIGQWNRFIITMKGDRLTVNLNGQTVIDNAQLPDVPRRGPIALQHRGAPIQFASIFVKEL